MDVVSGLGVVVVLGSGLEVVGSGLGVVVVLGSVLGGSEEDSVVDSEVCGWGVGSLVVDLVVLVVGLEVVDSLVVDSTGSEVTSEGSQGTVMVTILLAMVVMTVVEY